MINQDADRTMIDYIKGELVELTPTEAVIETGGIGYSILISLQSFSALQDNKAAATLYIHHYLREDEELYYGFATKDERALFRLLIRLPSSIQPNSPRLCCALGSSEKRTAKSPN